MTQPAKVSGFLDVAGSWDASLVFVMAGAVGVYFVASRFRLRRATPFVGERYDLPTRKDLDRPLLLGAALFGVGWGIGGYCPGPGLTALGSGSIVALTFVVAMVAGMLLFDQLTKSRTDRADDRAIRSTP